MIGRRIKLLENFSLCTEVVKFYGMAHRSYLLIARLSKKSRKMLDNNYEGIMNSLKENAAAIDINKDNLNMLSLPCDLFKYSFVFKDSLSLTKFLDFLVNINQKNGYYYNKHFMHGRIRIRIIHIHSSLFDEIYPYHEMLKKIETLEYDGNNMQELKHKDLTLINRISFCDEDDFIIDREMFIFPK